MGAPSSEISVLYSIRHNLFILKKHALNLAHNDLGTFLKTKLKLKLEMQLRTTYC